jgi:tetratricopeptide (TPR) repeat protein
MIKRLVAIATVLAMTALIMVAQSADEQKAIADVRAAAAKGVDSLADAVDAFVAKFPKSSLKPAVYTAVADAYEGRGNSARAQIYYLKTLEADPKNYYAMLMMASEIAKGTPENDIEGEAARTAKLNKAEKYAKDGLSLLALAPKPNPDASDADWAAVKLEDEARGHEALGMVAMARKKYDNAVTEFKQASQAGGNPQPTAMIRLAGAYNELGKYPDAISTLEKVLAIKDLPDAYKKVATPLLQAATNARDGKK